jgi:hypothetical protein
VPKIGSAEVWSGFEELQGIRCGLENIGRDQDRHRIGLRVQVRHCSATRAPVLNIKLSSARSRRTTAPAPAKLSGYAVMVSSTGRECAGQGIEGEVLLKLFLPRRVLRMRAEPACQQNKTNRERI